MRLTKPWSAYDVCRRQVSWYRYSRFVGKYLLVSDTVLSNLGVTPETVIRKIKFYPPELSDIGKGNPTRLTYQAAFNEATPAEWNDIEEGDIPPWLRRRFSEKGRRPSPGTQSVC